MIPGAITGTEPAPGTAPADEEQLHRNRCNPPKRAVCNPLFLKILCVNSFILTNLNRKYTRNPLKTRKIVKKNRGRGEGEWRIDKQPALRANLCALRRQLLLRQRIYFFTAA